jgi:DNA-binding NarL/FixJ family response regulator
MTRILIADESDVVRSGLHHILESRSDWRIVAEAGDGKEAILQAIRFRPNVAVIEYFLPVVDGLEATDHIRRRCPRTEVLIFTTVETEALAYHALAAGARGFILKSDPADQLVEAIASLAAHKPFFTDSISHALLQSFHMRRGARRKLACGPLS